MAKMPEPCVHIISLDSTPPTSGEYLARSSARDTSSTCMCCRPVQSSSAVRSLRCAAHCIRQSRADRIFTLFADFLECVRNLKVPFSVGDPHSADRGAPARVVRAPFFFLAVAERCHALDFGTFCGIFAKSLSSQLVALGLGPSPFCVLVSLGFRPTQPQAFRKVVRGHNCSPRLPSCLLWRLSLRTHSV